MRDRPAPVWKWDSQWVDGLGACRALGDCPCWSVRHFKICYYDLACLAPRSKHDRCSCSGTGSCSWAHLAFLPGFSWREWGKHNAGYLVGLVPARGSLNAALPFHWLAASLSGVGIDWTRDFPCSFAFDRMSGYRDAPLCAHAGSYITEATRG